MTTLAGPFTVRRLDNGTWQLSAAASAAEIYLRAAGRNLAGMMQDRDVRELALEWHGNGVGVRAAQGLRFEASTVLVHEPCSDLYERLPLASFDADAKRFWQRVFRLMRIPGGRLLLGLIARRNRRSKPPAPVSDLHRR